MPIFSATIRLQRNATKECTVPEMYFIKKIADATYTNIDVNEAKSFLIRGNDLCFTSDIATWKPAFHQMTGWLPAITKRNLVSGTQ